MNHRSKITTQSFDPIGARQKALHVSIMEPIDQKEAKRRDERQEQKIFSLFNQELIPIDDFSTGYTYVSNLGRFCKNIVIVSARHPHSFFIQTADDLAFYDNFFSKMNEFYNRYYDSSRLAISKTAIRTDLCCVARDPNDNDVWNRAQVLDYQSETNECSLLLVDLGTWQEGVPQTHLRHILVPFQREPVRSVPCRLAGIAPAKPEKYGLWNEYAIRMFRSVITNVLAEVEVLDCSPSGSYFVNLFVTQETFVCVNDFLLYHKIAIAVEDSKILKEEEFDKKTGQPMLSIIYEYYLQGKILANDLRKKQRRRKKRKELQKHSLDDRLPLLRIVDLPDYSSSTKLIFARYNEWILIPWFCISALFDPPLSSTTIERFAIFYKFSPIVITPLTHTVLLDQLETWLHVLLKLDFSERQTTMTLYSIDYVRKFLMNRQFNNRFVFDRLDEARVAEMKNDLEFWQFDDQNVSMVDKGSLDQYKNKSSSTILKNEEKLGLKNRTKHQSLVQLAAYSTTESDDSY